MIDDDARPARSPHLRLVPAGDAEALVTADGTAVLTLNTTAAALWQLCDGETTVAEIACAARDLVGDDLASHEVRQALELLARQDAVELLGDPAVPRRHVR